MGFGWVRYMYVQVIDKKESHGFISKLQVRLRAECSLDSPIHVLPNLLSLLSEKSLSSYALHFTPNQHGRFDVEINSVYPEVKQGLSRMNLETKVRRLYGLFYKEPKDGRLLLDYEDFIHALSQYEPLYEAEDDKALFNHATSFSGMARAYQFLTPCTDNLADDKYYHILNQLKGGFVQPAMGKKRCAFDKRLFLDTQVISKFKHFLVSINYRPIGDSRFHVMIIPHAHAADLTNATPEHVSELETLMRAAWGLWKHDDTPQRSYLQKHVQSGMSVPHMHVHVLCPSTHTAFHEDVLQQLRYFACSMAGADEEARSFLRGTLSAEVMDDIIREYSRPAKEAFQREERVQKTFKVHRPSRLN